MKKWMPLRGNFIQSGEDVIFQGVPQTENKATIYMSNYSISPDGIILFEDLISNGIIETTVSFEKFDKDDLAQIVFNYQNDTCYMCAGVGNTLAKYGFNYVNGQANTISATGFMDDLPIAGLI